MHVMVDLETLSLRPDGVIIQLAAVRFSQDVVEVDGALLMSLDPGDQVRHGRHLDHNTLAWWCEERRRELFASILRRGMLSSTRHLPSALKRLRSWLRGDDVVWAHSPQFDISMLEHAYRAQGEEPPWHHRSVRDTRTLYWLRGLPLRAEGRERESLISDAESWLGNGFLEHNALHDAVLQSLQVQRALLSA